MASATRRWMRARRNDDTSSTTTSRTSAWEKRNVPGRSGTGATRRWTIGRVEVVEHGVDVRSAARTSRSRSTSRPTTAATCSSRTVGSGSSAVRRRTTSRTLDGTSPPADTAPSDRSGSCSASTRCASSVAKNGLPSARSWMAATTAGSRSRPWRRGAARRSGGGTGPGARPGAWSGPATGSPGPRRPRRCGPPRARARCRPAARADRRARGRRTSAPRATPGRPTGGRRAPRRAGARPRPRPAAR